MQYDARQDRGISNLTSFSVEIAGAVGYELTGAIVNDTPTKGSACALLLDGGQTMDFVIDKVQEVVSGEGITEYHFTAYQAGMNEFKKSLKKTHHYSTLTEQAFARLCEQLSKSGQRDDSENYVVYHLKKGDRFGRRGWKTGEVIKQMAAYVGIEVVYGIRDFWVSDCVIPLGSSALAIALELVSVLDPIVELEDGVLMIMPRVEADQLGGALMAGSTIRYTVGDAGEYASSATVLARGGYGVFRLDMAKGDTFTGYSHPGNVYRRLDRESRWVRNIIEGITWQGDIEVEQKADIKSDDTKERRVETRYWLLSPTSSDPVVGIASRIAIFDTTGFFEDLRRLEETVNIFEGLNYSCQAPRPIKTVSIVSGYGWGMTAAGTVERRWYSPLYMTAEETKYSMDGLAIQESKLETVTGVIGTFEDAPAAGEKDDRDWVKAGIEDLDEKRAMSLREIRSDVDDKTLTLIEEREVQYIPVSPYVYEMRERTKRVVPVRESPPTVSQKVALSDVPQHPLEPRGMNVYYETGGVGEEGVQDTQGVETSPFMIVDWDDIQEHGIKAARERGEQLEAEVSLPKGALLLPRGMPFGIAGKIVGVCEGCRISFHPESGYEATAKIKERAS